MQKAWTDDATLTRMVHLPWTQAPGAAILAGYTNEATVHAWDLARATGQSPTWDDRVVGFAFDGIRQSLPAENRVAMFTKMRAENPAMGSDAPFAEVVTVPAGAPLIDQLVAYNGRRP